MLEAHCSIKWVNALAGTDLKQTFKGTCLPHSIHSKISILSSTSVSIIGIWLGNSLIVLDILNTCSSVGGAGASASLGMRVGFGS